MYAVYTSTTFQQITNKITQQKDVGAGRSIPIGPMQLVGDFPLYSFKLLNHRPLL